MRISKYSVLALKPVITPPQITSIADTCYLYGIGKATLKADRLNPI
jgi:hypothetical protein